MKKNNLTSADYKLRLMEVVKIFPYKKVFRSNSEKAIHETIVDEKRHYWLEGAEWQSKQSVEKVDVEFAEWCSFEGWYLKEMDVWENKLHPNLGLKTSKKLYDYFKSQS